MDLHDYKYSVGTSDLKNAYKIQTVWCEDDTDYLAEECAEDYHGNHDGWESSWPLDIFLFTHEGNSLGKFRVTRDYDPVFSASEVQP